MTKKVVLFFILLLLSICIVSISALLETNIKSYHEFRNAKFGLPVPFLYQDLYASGLNDYLGGFPKKFSIHMDFLDNDPQITFNKPNFILSVIIIFSALMSFYFIFRKINKNKEDV